MANHALAAANESALPTHEGPSLARVFLRLSPPTNRFDSFLCLLGLGRTFPVFLFFCFGLFLVFSWVLTLVLFWPGSKGEGQLCPFSAQSTCIADPPTTTKIIIITLRQKYGYTQLNILYLFAVHYEGISPPFHPARLDYLSGHSAKKRMNLPPFSHSLRLNGDKKWCTPCKRKKIRGYLPRHHHQ